MPIINLNKFEQSFFEISYTSPDPRDEEILELRRILRNVIDEVWAYYAQFDELDEYHPNQERDKLKWETNRDFIKEVLDFLEKTKKN